MQPAKLLIALQAPGSSAGPIARSGGGVIQLEDMHPTKINLPPISQLFAHHRPDLELQACRVAFVLKLHVRLLPTCCKLGKKVTELYAANQVTDSAATYMLQGRVSGSFLLHLELFLP